MAATNHSRADGKALICCIAKSILARKMLRSSLERARFRRALHNNSKLLKGTSMTLKDYPAAFAAFVAFTFMSVAAVADDHPFTEGQVVNVSAIRTEYGKFEEYMKFLDTTWKATQEAAKKAGYSTGYRVITVEPRGENDPDIYLVVYYKNWAALDGATAKGDAIANQVEGSVAAANKGAVDRGKIRRILGSWTGQQLDLK
jgi:hypothetical protein